MDTKELRTKNVDELKQELIELNKASFGLRMQKASGQLSKPSEIKKIRREIARVKTILTEKGVSL